MDKRRIASRCESTNKESNLDKQNWWPLHWPRWDVVIRPSVGNRQLLLWPRDRLEILN